jgi:Tfp pilus assembly PilM family ATPase
MTVALSIDGSGLRIVKSSGRKIEKWDTVGLEPQLIKEGLITDTARMGEIIKQALKERKLSAKNVRWSLPSIGSSSQIITLPDTVKGNLETTIQREARRVLAVSPETTDLHWQMLPGSGGQRRVYAVAIPKEAVRSLIAVCKNAGVVIESIDLKGLSLARAIDQKSAIIANGEMNSVEMIIVLDSIPALMRGIWLREKNLDTAKVTALLLQQLASTIEYYNDMNRTNPLPADVPIYLTGEIALNTELAQRVSTLSGRTVAPLELTLSYPEHFPVALYMVNLGLILK